MAFELTRPFTGIATGAIAQYRFVVSAANGRVAQATAGADAVGVSAEAAAAAGDAINVNHVSSVRVLVEAGGAIDVSSAAVPVASDATGRAIVAAGANAVIGYAEQSTTAAGAIIPVLLAPKPANFV